MVMFHEFLDRFEEGTAYIKRTNPKFGLRWITWPTNTLCAAVAWHNHPPAEATPATVLAAITTSTKSAPSDATPGKQPPSPDTNNPFSGHSDGQSWPQRTLAHPRPATSRWSRAPISVEHQ